MNMGWYPEGGLQFGVFRNKVQQLKYVGKCITHTPGTLHAILLGVLNHMAQLTSQNYDLYSKRVDSIYPAHTNTLRKAGPAPSILPTMGEW